MSDLKQVSMRLRPETIEKVERIKGIFQFKTEADAVAYAVHFLNDRLSEVIAGEVICLHNPVTDTYEKLVFPGINDHR